jgi:periplasmic protein TonB
MLRYIILFFSLLCLAITVRAQDSEPAEGVFTKVDVMPEYPGGMDDLSYFFYTHLKYPEEAKKNKIEGTVFISFVVDENGKVKNVKTVKSVHPLLDKEAVRVASQMPVWTPGKQSGKTVKVLFNLPVKFSLENDK